MKNSHQFKVNRQRYSNECFVKHTFNQAMVRIYPDGVNRIFDEISQLRLTWYKHAHSKNSTVARLTGDRFTETLTPSYLWPP